LVVGLGFLWILPWYIINKAVPSQHRWLSDEEKKYILEGQQINNSTTEERVLSVKELLSFRQSWSVILSRFMLDPIWWLFVSWLPIYLNDRFNFDIKQIGAFAWFQYVGAAIGSLGGGWLAGRFIGMGWSVNKARKTCIMMGSILMLPALIASAFANSPEAAMVTIFIALMGFQITINNIQTLPSDFFSGKSVGTLAGIGGTSAVFGVLITTWLVPVLTKESYTPFFIMAAILVPIGTFMVMWLSGEIKKLA
jgi:MFS transporter, ACS family, hexuronate transporter